MPDLYRMYDKRGTLLYVGVSVNAGARAAQHAAGKSWWPDVNNITVEHFDCSWPTILSYEKRAINNERPLHNIQHNRQDQYVERITVRPFHTPDNLAWDSAEVGRLLGALGDLAHMVRRRYGMATLASDGPFDALGLIENMARSAHIPLLCPKCAAELAASVVSVKDSTITAHAACQNCRESASTTIDWELV
jgi:predicted GIY-YIG superfamily endonuclease